MPCLGYWCEEHSITTALHGDEFLRKSNRHGLDLLDRVLADAFAIKAEGRFGPGAGAIGRMLKRALGWDGIAFTWSGDESHVQRLAEMLGAHRRDAVSHTRVGSDRRQRPHGPGPPWIGRRQRLHVRPRACYSTSRWTGLTSSTRCEWGYRARPARTC